MGLISVSTILLVLVGGVLGQQKKDLHIATLFPYTGNWPTGDAMSTAANIALENINNRDDILPDYNLILTGADKDTKYEVREALKLLFELLREDPPVKIMVLGVGNSEGSQLTASVSENYNLVQMTYASVTPLLSNKDNYPWFFRTSASEALSNPARVDMMRLFGWENAAIIRQPRPLYDSVVADFEMKMEENGYNVLASEGYFGDPTPQLQKIKDSGARVIFGFVLATGGVRVICEAHKLGMTGPDWVWIFPGLFDSRWWLTAAPNMRGGCTDAEMNEAAEGSFSPGDTTVNPDNTQSISMMTPTQFRAEYDRRIMNSPKNLDPEPFGTNLMTQAHDAVFAIALALDKTEKELQNQNPSEALSDFTYQRRDISEIIHGHLKETDFVGMKGRIRFDDNQDVRIRVRLRRVQDGVFQVVARENDDGRLILNAANTEELVWEDGRAPSDSEDVPLPPCNGAHRNLVALPLVAIAAMTAYFRVM